jgi:hypothetical protein
VDYSRHAGDGSALSDSTLAAIGICFLKKLVFSGIGRVIGASLFD